MKFTVYQTNVNNQGRIAEKQIEAKDIFSATNIYLESTEKIDALSHIVVIDPSGDPNGFIYEIDALLTAKNKTIKNPEPNVAAPEIDELNQNKPKHSQNRIPWFISLSLAVFCLGGQLANYPEQARKIIDKNEKLLEINVLMQELIVKQNSEMLTRFNFQLILLSFIVYSASKPR
jgi:hypothetical protein